MAKKTYIAQNQIVGLELPGAKGGQPSVLEAGAECVLDEEAAASLVACGALVEKLTDKPAEKPTGKGGKQQDPDASQA